MFQSKRKNILRLLISIGILILLANCRDAYNDLILDNRDHWLPCEQWPTVEEVNQIVAKHEVELQKILSVNDKEVFYSIDVGRYVSIKVRHIAPGLNLFTLERRADNNYLRFT